MTSLATGSTDGTLKLLEPTSPAFVSTECHDQRLRAAELNDATVFALHGASRRKESH